GDRQHDEPRNRQETKRNMRHGADYRGGGRERQAGGRTVPRVPSAIAVRYRILNASYTLKLRIDLASPWPVPESHRGELFTAKSRQVIQRKRAQQDSEPFATSERESRRFPRTAGRSFLATRGSGRAGLGPATSWFASSRRHAISLILRDSGSDLDGLFH